MRKTLISIAVIFSVLFFACKKSSVSTPDVKTYFVGNWAGSQQVVGASVPYKFSLVINTNNTVVNIDSAFSNQSFPGTYTYTSDSIFINYNNTTKWRMKFSTNYTACTGTLLGFAGDAGTVSMTKK